jgi:two-component system, LytTR family, sensor kinase
MTSTRPPRISWVVIIAVWTLPALADVIDTYVSIGFRGIAPDLRRIVLLVAPGWYAWAAMTPAIAWLTRRFPLVRPVRPRAIAAQIIASALAVSIHVAVLWASSAIFDPTERFVSGRHHYVDALANWAPISLLIYWAVVIAVHAYDSMRRASALSAELAQSRLAALRAQLQPHFLFNTLNAAVSLVRMGRSDDGVKVLTDLSEILRHLLRETRAHEVPLREELALLQRYLDIERARYANRLSIELAVDEQLLDALVPSLILQPLVENAIRHGVAAREAPTAVGIEVRSAGSTLALRVRDDGPGLPPGWEAERCTGVGLRNTRARLAGLYGETAHLRVNAGQSGGVDAEVNLPLRFAGDHG